MFFFFGLSFLENKIVLAMEFMMNEVEGLHSIGKV